MKVYALVGKSGTGKSYQAMNLCREKGIESIIDDGLYIYKAEALGGRSAKREPTKVGAIKTALFSKDDHRDEVVQFIDETGPESILLLGTSDGMVHKIQKRLGLPEIQETIYIEEITTEGERNIAKKQRTIHGKHVVPAPTFQLKRQFSGYFMDPLRIFRGWGFGKDSLPERSVVRPTYSYLGDFIISDKVIRDIVEYTAQGTPGVAEAFRILEENRAEEVRIVILATFSAKYNAIEVGQNLQKKVAGMLEQMTALNVEQIDVEVRGLV